MATIVQPEPAVTASVTQRPRDPFRRLLIGGAILVVIFGLPLLALVRFALRSELYSYVLLVPAISVYLAWQRKAKRSDGVVECGSGGESENLRFDISDLKGGKAKRSGSLEAKGSIGVWEYGSGEKTKGSDGVVENWSGGKISKATVLFLGFGVLLVAGRFAAGAMGWRLAPVDSLAWITLAFVVLFIGMAILTLGPRISRELAFPLFFLIFMVPFPQAVEAGIESFLQHRSADAAEMLFNLVGTPLLRSDTAFQLPGFSLRVAPECSGIHSSLVLFMVSLVAGQLFLRTPWKKALFALLVIPLGIVRNGIRIVTIGELCVHVDPAFIDSPIHHKGGPLFFAVSMVPFLLLLWYLRKTDLKKLKPENRN